MHHDAWLHTSDVESQLKLLHAIISRSWKGSVLFSSQQALLEFAGSSFKKAYCANIIIEASLPALHEGLHGELEINLYITEQ